MLQRLVLPLVALLASAPLARAEDKPFIFGLQRTVSNSKAEAEATAVEGYLSEALKHPVKARSYETYDELSAALAKGEVDIAWINPIPYVKATTLTPDIQPLAKAIRHGATYRSVIYVRADSKAKTLADLKGSKAAWVDKDSSAGYLYPRAMFLKSGAVLNGYFGSEKFYGTHALACQAVLAGDADFGATFLTGSENADLRVDGCANALGDAAKDKFRALVGSEAIPNEVIAVRAKFDQDTADKLGSVFGAMSSTEAGLKILKEVFDAEGFGAALETDFDTVRAVAKLVASPSASVTPATDAKGGKAVKPMKEKKKKAAVKPAAAE